MKFKSVIFMYEFMFLRLLYYIDDVIKYYEYFKDIIEKVE